MTIAHRLSTAEAADQVFVFDAGALVQQGTHAELVATAAACTRAARELAGQHRGRRRDGGHLRWTTRSQPLRDQAAEALFPVEGELHAPGLDAPGHGHPRSARHADRSRPRRQHDLWFAQGMVTAGERLPQIDLALRAANGRLSEVFGALTLEVDRFVRTIGLHLAGAAMAARWDEADHAMHARFRDGVRAWMGVAPAPPLEYRMLGGAPKLPDDPAAWAVVLRLPRVGPVEQPRRRSCCGRGSATTRARRRCACSSRRRRGRDARGSNAWAVAGDRTASGMPILANDPHLLALHPGAWIPCTCGRRATTSAAWRCRSRPGSCSARRHATPGAPRTSPATCRTCSR